MNKIKEFNAKKIFNSNEIETLAAVLNPIAKALDLPSFYAYNKETKKCFLKNDKEINDLAISILQSIQNGNIIEDLQSTIEDKLDKKEKDNEFKKEYQALKAKFKR